MNIKKYIPKPLKYPLIALYVFWRCLARSKAEKGKTILNLAGVLPPLESKKIVHGGKVKLLHLREQYGDSWKKFNLAYFVSSGLPFAPSIWLRIYKLFGVRVVWNQNGVAYPALYPPETVGKVNKLLLPIHESEYVVYQTEFVKRCADKYLGVYRGPSSVIINSVDTDLFIPRPSPMSTNELVILTSGNHHESKTRMMLTLKTLRTLRDQGISARLIILGDLSRNPDGMNEQEIDQVAQDLGLEGWVEKRGPYLQKDAPTLFQEAHIFLHLKYLDPCPPLILEALSSGLPVVASASGGLPEMVDEKSGVLIPIVEDFDKLHYPTVEEITNAIVTISRDIRKFSDAARKRAVSQLNKKEWLRKHEIIFKEILK